MRSALWPAALLPVLAAAAGQERSAEIADILSQRQLDPLPRQQVLAADAADLEGHVGVELRGNRLRYQFNPVGMPYGKFQVRFDGHVRGNTMQGTLAVSEKGQTREHWWQAQRDVVDLAGEWEWLLLLNPVAPILEGLKNVVVYGISPKLMWIAYSGAIAVVSIIIGLSFFKTLEPKFAENI